MSPLTYSMIYQGPPPLGALPYPISFFPPTQLSSSVSSSSIAVVNTPKVCLLDAPTFARDPEIEAEDTVVGPRLLRVFVGELGCCCCAVERQDRARLGVGPCCVELDAPEEAEVADAKETVAGWGLC
jgi:hypothetical protein